MAASVGAQSDRLAIAWLMIPWVTAAFGWAWVHTDDKVTAIAHWLATTGDQPGQVVSWEHSAKGLLPTRLRRAGDRAAFGIVFVAPAPLAVGVFVAGWIGDHGWRLGTVLLAAAVVVVECTPCVALAAVYAYATRRASAEAADGGSRSAA